MTRLHRFPSVSGASRGGRFLGATRRLALLILAGLGLGSLGLPLALTLGAEPIQAQERRSYTPDGFEFPLTTPGFKYHFPTRGLRASRFEGTWFAETVQGVQPDQRIDTAVVDAPSTGVVYFTLRPEQTPWPTGLYRLEIRADGRLVHTERFVLR